MAVGMFRSEEGWVQVDYGTGNIPIPRSKYEENKYKPDYDKLRSEAEYQAAPKKRRRMMPRGPKGEKHPVDVIGAAVVGSPTYAQRAC